MLKISRKYFAPIALLLVSIVGTAYAFTQLFSQTFPAISAVSPATSNCSSLITNVTSVIPTTSGGLSFGCAAPTIPGGIGPAFTVASSTTSATVTLIPTFATPSGYAALYVALDSAPQAPLAAPPCTTGNGSQITPGAPIALVPGGSYQYCATYSNVSTNGLASFQVTWNV